MSGSRSAIFAAITGSSRGLRTSSIEVGGEVLRDLEHLAKVGLRHQDQVGRHELRLASTSSSLTKKLVSFPFEVQNGRM